MGKLNLPSSENCSFGEFGGPMSNQISWGGGSRVPNGTGTHWWISDFIPRKCEIFEFRKKIFSRRFNNFTLSRNKVWNWPFSRTIINKSVSRNGPELRNLVKRSSFNSHSQIDFLDLFPTLISNEDIRNESESGS